MNLDTVLAQTWDALYGQNEAKIKEIDFQNIKRTLPEHESLEMTAIKGEVLVAITRAKSYFTPHQKIKEINGFRKRAESLLKAFNSLSDSARLEIASATFSNKVGAQECLDCLISTIENAELRVSPQLKKTGGKTKNQPIYFTIMTLANAYYRITGAEPKAYFSAINEAAEGRFVRFVQAVFVPLELRIADKSICNIFNKLKKSIDLPPECYPKWKEE